MAQRGGARPGAGRPHKSKAKLTKELMEIIDSAMSPEEMIGGIAKLAKDVDTPHATRIVAYRELMDRRYGKAPQAITGPDGGPLQLVAAIGKASDAQLEELIASLGAGIYDSDD